MSSLSRQPPTNRSHEGRWSAGTYLLGSWLGNKWRNAIVKTKTIWDSAQHVVFERGITFRKLHQLWLCTTADQSTCGMSPEEFLLRSNFRPIRVEIDRTSKPLAWLLPREPGRALDLRVEDAIYYRDWDRSHYLKHLRIANAQYCLGLLLHQCKRLAATYSSTLEFLLPFARQEERGRLTMSRQFELYFDFDEVITAGIRALDSFRSLVWHGFGEPGSVPSSFPRTVSTATRIPNELKQLIARSQPLFDEAKEFRDCIQHYFSPGVHTDFADIIRLGQGVWCLTAWLPDNVKTRSALQFTYGRNTDALSFAWEFANRVVCVFEEIAKHVASEKVGPSVQSEVNEASPTVDGSAPITIEE